MSSTFGYTYARTIDRTAPTICTIFAHRLPTARTVQFKWFPGKASEAQWKCVTIVDPSDEDRAHVFPRVCVQCPIYNDREVCERVIDACANLEYPRSRMEVFVMDDSTDAETKRKIDERVAFWAASGTDIKLCRRPNRTAARCRSRGATTG